MKGHVRRSELTPLRCAAVAALFCFTAIPALRAETSPPSGQSIQDVERDLNAAQARERKLASDAAAQVHAIEELRTQLSAAALATQDSEERLSQVETTLTALDEQQLAKAAELERRRAELSRLLAALTRLARNPPEALMLMPTSPADTVRTARLLGDVVPPIEAKAKAVARDVDELRAVRTQVAAQRAALTAATQRLSQNHGRLQRLMAERAALYQETEAAHAEAAEQVIALGRQAANLRELMQRLEERSTAARAAPPAAAVPSVETRVSEALGRQLRHLVEPKPGQVTDQMLMPARGRVLLSYGDQPDGAPPQRGLTIETRPGAAVVAPFDGKIVFAGPFRGYGRILIIEHGEAYHTLLAGLGRIDVSVGQLVARGEPIATASSPDTAGPTDVSAPADIYSKGATGPVLYVELRRHGQPINPLPWLAISDRKVSG